MVDVAFPSTIMPYRLLKGTGLKADLLFRLRAFVIELPPLRERGEDIWELAQFHISKICKRTGEGTKGVAPAFTVS